jgi:hypothetical protein
VRPSHAATGLLVVDQSGSRPGSARFSTAPQSKPSRLPRTPRRQSRR